MNNIFVIDDEPANCRLIRDLLHGQGYDNIVQIEDSRQVIAHYQAARPDLILLDLKMPYLDGYQVIEQLQALADPMLPPIVVLTAQHDRDSLLNALASGARDFISSH